MEVELEKKVQLVDAQTVKVRVQKTTTPMSENTKFSFRPVPDGRKIRTSKVELLVSGPDWRLVHEELNRFVGNLSFPVQHAHVGLPVRPLNGQAVKGVGFVVCLYPRELEVYMARGEALLPGTTKLADGSVISVYVDLYQRAPVLLEVDSTEFVPDEQLRDSFRAFDKEFGIREFKIDNPKAFRHEEDLREGGFDAEKDAFEAPVDEDAELEEMIDSVIFM